jgi:hypothetical protein
VTTWVEGQSKFVLAAGAALITDGHEEAADAWWAPHVRTSPCFKWLVGRFVEADRANSNRQMFSLEGLQMGRPHITHAPMNLNHFQRRIVGAYVATDLIYPVDGQKADESTQLNPHIEALGVVWKHFFPGEVDAMEHAHAEGQLAFSMECVPRQIRCTGDGGCEQTFEYAGRQSDTYCEHLNETASDKLLIDPVFTAGAVLLPPVKPGWKHADIHSIVSSYSDEELDAMYRDVASTHPEWDPKVWEAAMEALLMMANR